MCNNSNFMDYLFTSDLVNSAVYFLVCDCNVFENQKSQFRFIFLYFSMNRENLETKEISIHHVEIKKEPQNLYEGSELRDVDLDIKNLKEETAYFENQIDKDEQFSNEADHENAEIEDDRPLKRKKPKKKSMKSLPHVDLPEPPAGLLENYYDLDLSVEFLSQLFEYVNELCEYINDGDRNVNRSSVVIQNLNDAVSCYQDHLPVIDPTQAIKGGIISEGIFILGPFLA